MPAGTQPIFVDTPKASSVAVTAANTSSQGGGTIGTDIFLAYTAGPDGAYVAKVLFRATATTPTTTTATVARIFWSTQASGATTNANTHLIGEVALPAVGADNATTPAPPVEVPLNLPLPANATILITNHAAPAANTQWKATVFAGDY